MSESGDGLSSQSKSIMFGMFSDIMRSTVCVRLLRRMSGVLEDSSSL